MNNQVKRDSQMFSKLCQALPLAAWRELCEYTAEKGRPIGHLVSFWIANLPRARRDKALAEISELVPMIRRPPARIHRWPGSIA